jgi:hypothetical protein
MTGATGIDREAPPSGPGCVECEVSEGWWLHLRRCAQCGHIGCCDDSLSQHASRHVADTAHTIIRSYEPEEDWFYSYETKRFYDGPVLKPPLAHPIDQPTPGPASRVPRSWKTILQERDARAGKAAE